MTDSPQALFIIGVGPPRRVWQLKAWTGRPAQVQRLRRSLWRGLGAMALVLLLVQGSVLRWSLRPLRRVTAELAEIEAGRQLRQFLHRAFSPESLWRYYQLVEWKTIAALIGLLVVSTGVKESGYLTASHWGSSARCRARDIRPYCWC